jgi:IclR family KDG regulon transcriptional repressor
MNQSVQKAFEILSFVVEHPQKLSLNRMAQALGMNKTTLFRFLNTLESLDILAKHDECYVPGIKLFEWGSKVPVKHLLVDQVHPLLRRLTLEVNETVNLGEFSNQQVLYLDKTESRRSLQIQTSAGSYTSMHTSALGKSILSILPPTLRQTVIQSLVFERKTRHTITDPRELTRQVEQVKETGYSTDREELEEGLHCVAVPLFIRTLNFYGAISCSGPTVRFTTERIAELAAKLNETVARIHTLFNTGEHT